MKKRLSKIVLITLILIMALVPTFSARAEEEDKESQLVIIESAEEAIRAGTYYIKVSADGADGEEMSELLKLNVMYPNTVLNNKNEEGIDAHDIVVTPGGLRTLSKYELVDKASAHAWSTETGNEIPIDYVAPTYSKGKQGSVGKVEYGTSKGTSVGVSVYEQQEIHLDLGELYINQQSVIGDSASRIRLISIVIGSIIIVPAVVFILVFIYVNIMKNRVTKFLYVEQKDS